MTRAVILALIVLASGAPADAGCGIFRLFPCATRHHHHHHAQHKTKIIVVKRFVIRQHSRRIDLPRDVSPIQPVK